MKSRFPVCYCSAILGAITYIAFTLLAYVRYPLPFSLKQNWLSDLGNQIDNPQGAIFYNAGVILSAVFLAIWFTAGLSQWKLKHKTAHQRLLLISQIAGILAAFGMIMSAVYPINIFHIHAFWSQVHFMMFGMGFGFSVAALRYHPLLPKINLYIGASAAVLPTLMFIFGDSYWLEWAAVGCMIIYMLSIGKASLTIRLQNCSVPDKSLIDGQIDQSKEVTMKTIKRYIFKKKVLIPIIVVLVLLTTGSVYLRTDRQETISEFGKYQGYTEKLYDGYKRTSDFLTLSDGTRLAYDLYRPTNKGIPADKPYPALFRYTPYGRTWTIFDDQGKNNLAQLAEMKWYENLVARVLTWLVPDKNRVDIMFKAKWLGEMVKHGYVVVVVDRPGTGASFGKLDLSPEAGARETNEILNWIAAQTWSDGNIGMFGDSIQAQVQFQAAITGNPHLKAILPATTWMDNYSAVIYPGGIRNQAFLKFYAMANTTFDLLATPVDQDPTGELLAQARKERHGNALADLVTEMPEVAFRDDTSSEGKRGWEEGQWLYTILDEVNQSGIPVYLIDGWFDIYTRDDLVIYTNLTVPKRLLIRPTDHSNIEGKEKDVDYGAEAHRWFDYWLKGIDNGIMDEPPIHYSIMRGDGTTTTHAASGVSDVWPLKNQVLDRYYFLTGYPSNQGSLVSILPTDTSAQSATYTVDYSTTSGGKPRWSSPATARNYPNMRANDAKALTFTTPALTQTVQVTGHPVLHVWLSTEAADLDLFAYLEEVDQQGNSTYITEGCLRASNRALGQAPYEYFGLPFRSFHESDQRLIPAGEPVELVFDLLPTAYQFMPGKQIRVAITFADAGNFTTPVLDPAPLVHLLQDAAHPSFIELPVAENP